MILPARSGGFTPVRPVAAADHRRPATAHRELDLPSARRAALAQRLPVGRALLRAGVIETVARESLVQVPFTQIANLTGTPAMSVPLHWAAPWQGRPRPADFSRRGGRASG